MSPSNPETALPADLLLRLQAKRPALEVDACIQPRQDPNRALAWRLRFHDEVDGIRRHCSMVLPNEEAANAVKRLIAGWREERRREEEQARAKAEAAAAEERAERQWLKQMRRDVVNLGGGSWRRRRRTGATFDAAAKEGPRGILRYMMLSSWAEPSSKGGRRRRLLNGTRAYSEHVLQQARNLFANHAPPDDSGGGSNEGQNQALCQEKTA
jgi:hypothetical protein